MSSDHGHVCFMHHKAQGRVTLIPLASAADPDSAAFLAAEASSDAIALTLGRQQCRCTRRLYWLRRVEVSTNAQRDAVRKPENMSCKCNQAAVVACVVTGSSTADRLQASISKTPPGEETFQRISAGVPHSFDISLLICEQPGRTLSALCVGTRTRFASKHRTEHTETARTQNMYQRQHTWPYSCEGGCVASARDARTSCATNPATHQWPHHC
jgi:hypothetical protein